MDRVQFDALAKLVFVQQSRRTALATLLGAALLGIGPRRGDAKRKGKHKRKKRRNGKKGRPCYPGNDCIPGQGKDNSGCDFTRSVAFFELEAQGSNLSHANFTEAQLAGANLQGADLGGACLVGANLLDAVIDNSTNLKGAIFCQTLMPDGSFNDSGCEQDTRCCPTPPVCEAGEVCPVACADHQGATCSVFNFPFPNCCRPFMCTPLLFTPALTFCQLPCSSDAECIFRIGPNSRCGIDINRCPFLFDRCCSVG
jgi:hypothetical protein